MEYKIDLSKYIGEYTVEQAKEIISKIQLDIENTVPKPIMERVKNFEDVLKVLKIDSFKQKQDETLDEFSYRKLKLIARALNEDWQPDWSNSSEWKYYPYFRFVSGSGFACDAYGYQLTGTAVGSRLCFKTSKLAEYAGKTFSKEYNDYLSL